MTIFEITGYETEIAWAIGFDRLLSIIDADVGRDYSPPPPFGALSGGPCDACSLVGGACAGRLPAVDPGDQARWKRAVRTINADGTVDRHDLRDPVVFQGDVVCRLCHGQLAGRMPRILTDLIRLSLVLVGSLFVLSSVWGHDLGKMFAALGVGSILVGLARTGTVGQRVFWDLSVGGTSRGTGGLD